MINPEIVRSEGASETFQYNAIEAPIFCRRTLRDYDDLNSIEHASPTPLDPEGMYISVDGYDDAMNYSDASRMAIHQRVSTVSKRKNLSDEWRDLINGELQLENSIRCSHNIESFNRLKQAAVENPGHLDHSVLDIIRRARAGAAELAELTTLLDKYPETIALEAFKICKPFDARFYKQMMSEIEEKITNLGNEMPGVIVAREWQGKPFGSWQSLDDNGALIDKHVLAEINMPSGQRFEAIRKITFLQVPIQEDEENLNGRPLSLSYYLRTVDHKERLAGRVSYADSRRLSNSSKADSMLEGLVHISDPEMRRVYINAVRQSMGSLAIDQSN